MRTIAIPCDATKASTYGAFRLAMLSVLVMVTVLPAHSQTETVLYSFAGSPDGRNPYFMTPVLDRKRNLYGTTWYGGAYGYYGGTVFKLTPSGTETVLYSFNPQGTDGVGPYAGLVLDTAGNLYGTTYGGGTYGYGTVFKVTPSGTETILWSFSGGADGANPWASLVMDKNGNLYGTTLHGGGAGTGCGGTGCGTVFEVTPSGTETVLYSFNPANGDAESPYAGLVIDKKGNLYGTAGGGAYYYGAVFKVTPSGTETILHSFNWNGTDGTGPMGGLVLDKKGNLYGTTRYGGPYSPCYPYGCGTVFEITRSGTETVLYAFGLNGPDGYWPTSGLVRDKAGNLYGTTVAGGSFNGMVFELTPSGIERILHTFGENGDGFEAYGGLAIDKKGNLYGATTVGGTSGYGTVYKVTP